MAWTQHNPSEVQLDSLLVLSLKNWEYVFSSYWYLFCSSDCHILKPSYLLLSIKRAPLKVTHTSIPALHNENLSCGKILSSHSESVSSVTWWNATCFWVRKKQNSTRWLKQEKEEIRLTYLKYSISKSLKNPQTFQMKINLTFGMGTSVKPERTLYKTTQLKLLYHNKINIG